MTAPPHSLVLSPQGKAVLFQYARDLWPSIFTTFGWDLNAGAADTPGSAIRPLGNRHRDLRRRDSPLPQNPPHTLSGILLLHTPARPPFRTVNHGHHLRSSPAGQAQLRYATHAQIPGASPIQLFPPTGPPHRRRNGRPLARLASPAQSPAWAIGSGTGHDVATDGVFSPSAYAAGPGASSRHDDRRHVSAAHKPRGVGTGQF
ncbi:hypothetical protein FB45DRAFT_875768 [Roridomyces roridus]|uniref:Uncharacterized protein n=1 Tax=Roridomyces roridus TaxID=1738132 RepID=A0AAD7B4H2_9AGAR|nr:hypothetical protein FB45DRAFT_875768 [Roridomyces roridus]